MIHEIPADQRSRFAHFFENDEETMVWSCLQGHLGAMYTDSLTFPLSVQIITADFCFFAGLPNLELIQNRPESYRSDFTVMVPKAPGWAKMIESCYQGKYRKNTRFALKKIADSFHIPELKKFISALPPQYTLKMIDSEIYKLILQESWSESLCSNYSDFSFFREHGLGFVIFHGQELVSGASAYTFYDGGIEVEIDTKKSFQHRGLATVCGAKLILACLERNLYPSWDAQNPISLALAQKLGYQFDYAYDSYEIMPWI